MFLGYGDSEDITVELKLKTNNRCIFFKVSDLVKLPNNIFGYELLGIKVLSLPDTYYLRLYSESSTTSNTPLRYYEIISISNKLRVEVREKLSHANFVYVPIYQENQNFSESEIYTHYTKYYGEDPSNFYKPKTFDGKKGKIDFTFTLFATYKREDRDDYCGVVKVEESSSSSWSGGYWSSGHSSGGGGGWTWSSGGGWSQGSSSSTTTTPPSPSNCYESCFICRENSKSNNTIHNCEYCNSSYAYKEDLLSSDNETKYNCYKYPANYYYLDDLDPSKYILRKCYNTCLTCFGEGNDTNHSCILCRDGFYKKETEIDIVYNCYERTDGFYLNDKYDPPILSISMS